MNRETFIQWGDRPPQGPGWRFGTAVAYTPGEGETDIAVVWHRETDSSSTLAVTDDDSDPVTVVVL